MTVGCKFKGGKIMFYLIYFLPWILYLVSFCSLKKSQLLFVLKPLRSPREQQSRKASFGHLDLWGPTEPLTMEKDYSHQSLGRIRAHHRIFPGKWFENNHRILCTHSNQQVLRANPIPIRPDVNSLHQRTPTCLGNAQSISITSLNQTVNKKQRCFHMAF